MDEIQLVVRPTNPVFLLGPYKELDLFKSQVLPSLTYHGGCLIRDVVLLKSDHYDIVSS